MTEARPKLLGSGGALSRYYGRSKAALGSPSALRSYQPVYVDHATSQGTSRSANRV